MRILLAHEFYRSSAPSGEDVVFRNEKRMLASRGIELIPYEVLNDDIDDSTLPGRVRLGISTVWSIGTYRAMKRRIQDTRPDVAHFHNTFPLISPSAYKACHDCGVPVVQTLHNFRLVCPGALLQRENGPCEECLSGSIVNSLRHRCYRGSLLATAPLTGMIWVNRRIGTYRKYIDRYIALTRFAASRLIAGGLPAEKISIKPNFLPAPPPPGDGQGRFAVYTGRLGAEKGVRTLIEAWERIGDLPLRVLGDGPLRQELAARARARGLPIEFLGHCSRERVLEVVREASLQIIPSECYEGFPMVLLEAYATGTPVIASRIGSLDEIVAEGRTGRKFQPGDPASLAEAVMELWNSPRELFRLARQARKEFEERYTEDSNFVALSRIYQQVLGAVSTSGRPSRHGSFSGVAG